MSREIKFRAWDIRENRWMTSDEIFERVLVNPYCDGKKFQIDEKLMNGLARDIGYGFELMQYTGLKDKNGVEIYEGDLFQYLIEVDVHTQSETYQRERKCIDVIRYRYGSFWAGEELLIDAIENDEKAKIVGNIYENPELVGDTNGN